jgi:lipopolysaccharide exporter
MSLAARVGRAIFWGQAGRFAEAGILFIFSLLLARVLGPASYGLYALGMSLAGVCGFLTLLGLGPETLGRFLPEIAADGQRHRANSLLRALLGIRFAAIVFVACLVFIFRGAILAKLHFPLIIVSLVAVLLVFAARSILDLLTSFSSGLLDLRSVAVAKLAASAAAPALFLAFLIFRHANTGAAWLATAGSSLVGILVLASPFLRTRGSPVSGQRVAVRPILAFGMFAWTTNFFMYILGDNTDVLLLGFLLSERAAIGRYAVGAKIVFSLTGLLLGWAALVSVASFAESHQRLGKEAMARMVEAQWRLAVLCVVGPSLLLLRYAREIITTAYSADYAPSVPVTQVLCVLMACAAVLGFSLGTSALYAIGKERMACALVGAAATFNIVSEVFLVRRMGILGAAYATGLSFVVLALLSATASRIYVPWRFPAEFVGKVIVASSVALVPTFYIRADSIVALAAGSLAWGGAFFLGLLILKPLGPFDFAALTRINPRLAALAGSFSAQRWDAAAEGAPWPE